MKTYHVASKYLSTHPLLESVIILIIGAGILALAYTTGFPKLSGSDEIVYATAARNIANFKGPYTNFYLPASIAEKGYPLGDVHMPGYIFLLAISLFLFGPNEFAAFLPSQLTFLATGVLIFWIGKTVFNRQVGFWAALWFFLLPDNFIWANTAMAEPSLTLLSTIFLWIWYKAVTGPKLRYSFWLAFLLVLGLFFREVFLVFLLPALYALWVWPSSSRLKSWLIFGSLFLIGVSLLVPFHRIRAPYPWTVSVTNWSTLPELVAGIERTVSRNIEEISKVSTKPIYLAQIPKYVITLLVVGSLLVFERKSYKLSLYYLITFLPTFLIMFLIYIVYRWVGLRMFTLLMSAGIIAACAMLVRLRGKWRLVALGGGTLILLVASISMNNMHAQDREKDFKEQSLQAQTIVDQTSKLGLNPQVVMGNQPFLYGWQQYPVAVIWRTTSNLDTWLALRQWLTVDLIVVEEMSERDRFLRAIEDGLVEDNFVLLNQEPINGYYIFALE
jgi:4-amino-4-deoxy-L-arabinose transferase-like glycosyltransferase